ncbi:MAG: hypothetical protein C0518_01045 [Opitutus sp.]|nr:hypothetical protein [Opitutus sp.]
MPETIIAGPPKNASCGPVQVQDLARRWGMTEEELRALMAACALRDVAGFILPGAVEAAIAAKMGIPNNENKNG